MFEIKENKIPSIQIKRNLHFLPNEYLESSNGEIVTLTLTNIDLELMKKQYNLYFVDYQGGFKFKGIDKFFFNEYINYWTDRKIKAKKDNNDSIYKISKLMLNSLYGKFSKNPRNSRKKPYLDEDNILHFEKLPEEIGKPVFTAMGSFITSYARKKTIETSQRIRDYSIKKYGIDKYIYSDTDSIHCLFTDEEELKSFLDIDDYKLGAWKIESRFKRGKYLRQKCYIEEFDEINVTIAGLPKDIGKIINFDNFNIGFSINGKLVPKHVKGGQILENTTFTIK